MIHTNHMILSISTSHKPLEDLGYLLHKNPSRIHEFNLSFGKAQVFVSKLSGEEIEMTLMVDVDPVGLVRGKGPFDQGHSLSHYVNDRPYASSSFLSTAIADVFGTAMNGHCKLRPELVDVKLPLKVLIPVVPSTAGEEGIRKLFEPLGYEVGVEQTSDHSRYYEVKLSIYQTLQLVLQHLYVLIPVLDKNKHYYVSQDEIEKLVKKGGEWLANHPSKEWITRRYLKYQRKLTDEALERLEELENDNEDENTEHSKNNQSDNLLEEKWNLHEQRLGTVTALLKTLPIKSVADLGCGEGKLIRMILQQTSIPRILGMDVSSRALSFAKDRLHLDRMPRIQRDRIELILGSLMYRDRRLEGVDAITLIEVIEHMDQSRLKTMERIVFEKIAPRFVILTTPNAEYNVLFESLCTGGFRHSDHRFEWTRNEFSKWVCDMCVRFGYTHEISMIGPVHEEFGSPSQMVVFKRKESV